MDPTVIHQVAQWTTTQLAALWANPGTSNLALGVTANAVYDLVKHCFRKQFVAVAVLENARAAPQNAENLQELTQQIARVLGEDPAFLAELLKLAPSQFAQEQAVGDHSVANQIAGNQNSVTIKIGKLNIDGKVVEQLSPVS